MSSADLPHPAAHLGPSTPVAAVEPLRRARENNDVVAIMSAGVIEGSAAGDESELRVRGRAVYGRRGKSVFLIFTHRIHGEGDLRTVCAVDGNGIARLKCAESEENAGSASCRIDMPY